MTHLTDIIRRANTIVENSVDVILFRVLERLENNQKSKFICDCTYCKLIRERRAIKKELKATEKAIAKSHWCYSGGYDKEVRYRLGLRDKLVIIKDCYNAVNNQLKEIGFRHND